MKIDADSKVKTARTSLCFQCSCGQRITRHNANSRTWPAVRFALYQQPQLEMVQRCAARFVCNRYRQTSSVTNMMAGLDWNPLINRRRAFRLSMFYKMHSGLVAIHPTLYLTPRQYHTSHKYPHSRIDQHAFSFFPNTVRLWNKVSATSPQQHRHHH